MYSLINILFYPCTALAHGDKHVEQLGVVVTGNSNVVSVIPIEEGNWFMMIDPHTLSIALGILTFICLVLTNLSGIKRWPLKYHKLFAFLTVMLALSHAGVVIFF